MLHFLLQKTTCCSQQKILYLVLCVGVHTYAYTVELLYSGHIGTNESAQNTEAQICTQSAT